MEEVGLPGQGSESNSHNPFKYLGHGFEEDDDAERCQCVLRGLAWLVQDDHKRMFKTGRVVA